MRDNDLTAVLGQLLNSSPEAADAFAEALWARWPADPRLLAAAIRLAPGLPLLRALEWAARLRAAGLTERCPLVSIATDEAADPMRRLSAVCIAAATFGDPTGASAVALTASQLSPEAIPAALTTTAQLAPDLLSDVVMAAARTPERCLAVADALLDLGAAAEAIAVARYGHELATDTAGGEGCRAWLKAHADLAA